MHQVEHVNTPLPPAMERQVEAAAVVDVRDANRDADTRAMAHRYFGQSLGDMYVDSQSGEGGAVYVMRPERWRTVDYAKGMG